MDLFSAIRKGIPLKKTNNGDTQVNSNSSGNGQPKNLLSQIKSGKAKRNLKKLAQNETPKNKPKDDLSNENKAVPNANSGKLFNINMLTSALKNANQQVDDSSSNSDWDD